MRPDSAKNETNHVIRIDDYSIIISLAVTVLMICATVLASRVYSLKPPELPTFVPYSPTRLPDSRTLPQKTGPAATFKIPPRVRPLNEKAPVASGPVPPPAPPAERVLPAVSKKTEPGPPKTQTAGEAEVRHEKRARLEALRGGRHEKYVSIVFQLSDRIGFEKPRVSDNEIFLRLKDTASDLRPYRRYPTLDTWVRLREKETWLDVHMGLPRDFVKLHTFLMQDPHRLVVNLYDKNGAVRQRKPPGTERARHPAPRPKPDLKDIAAEGQKPPEPSVKSSIRLVTIRGGRHERYASIVFQFSGPIAFTSPQIEADEIRFTLKQVSTGLRHYRRYKTFDSWVSVEREGPDLKVRIGVLPHFIRMSAFLMQDPHRMVVNSYDR